MFVCHFVYQTNSKMGYRNTLLLSNSSSSFLVVIQNYPYRLNKHYWIIYNTIHNTMVIIVT